MPLPNSNEPLRLADGRVVYPDGRTGGEETLDAKPKFVEVPTHAEAQHSHGCTAQAE
jgi:hypothetical protein